ncbi:hypothetical protein NJ76_15715, partial [Rhodococcus sp. IITR03]
MPTWDPTRTPSSPRSPSVSQRTVARPTPTHSPRRLEREAKSATGLPGGIAIPHARSEAVTTPSLGFARLSPKADFGAPDGPADLVFLIAAPEGAGGDHMKLLTALARALVRPDFVASLRAAASADEVIALVEDVLPPRPAPSSSGCG